MCSFTKYRSNVVLPLTVAMGVATYKNIYLCKDFLKLNANKIESNRFNINIPRDLKVAFLLHNSSFIQTFQTFRVEGLLKGSILESLSNNYNDPEDKAWKKNMNLYFTFEFRKWLDLFNAPIDLRTFLS